MHEVPCALRRCSAAGCGRVRNGIFDTETLQAVLHDDAAGFARALCTALRAEAPSHLSTGTVTDVAMPMVETDMQTCLTADW